MPITKAMDGAKLLGTGLIAGLASHYAAAAFVHPAPKDFAYLFAVVERLIAVYAVVVGLWLGWLQKSWQRAAWGAGLGIAACFFCEAIRVHSPRSFFLVMLALPLLLGAALAAATGPGHKAGLRLIRGATAGAVFAFVYAGILLVSAMGMLAPLIDAPIPVFEAKFAVYAHMILPLAMALASMLFFPLIRWAALSASSTLSCDKMPAPTYD